VAAWEDGLTGSLSLSPSPSRTLVTPYCKRIRPGRRTTRAAVPLFVPPCVPLRADPSGLGHAATIYSSVQGPSGVKMPTGSDDEEDDGILSPSKPSHIEFGKSTVKAEDLVLMKKLGYFGKDGDGLVRFAGDEVISEPKDHEVIVFKSFFRVGLRFPKYEMMGEDLKKFENYLHQLTLNAIVRLSEYIWALRSQVMSANAEGFCRVHELHYKTKVGADGL
jgi:hypothetical protein